MGEDGYVGNPGSPVSDYSCTCYSYYYDIVLTRNEIMGMQTNIFIFMKYEQGCIFGSIQFYQFEFLGKRVTPKKRALPGLIHFSKQ